jgi:hypothetical protein
MGVLRRHTVWAQANKSVLARNIAVYDQGDFEILQKHRAVQGSPCNYE